MFFINQYLEKQSTTNGEQYTHTHTPTTKLNAHHSTENNDKLSKPDINNGLVKIVLIKCTIYQFINYVSISYYCIMLLMLV